MNEYIKKDKNGQLVTQAKNKRAESANLKRITLNKRYSRLKDCCVENPANF